MEKMLAVASGFQYAVNIGFDLNNDEKLKNGSLYNEIAHLKN